MSWYRKSEVPRRVLRAGKPGSGKTVASETDIDRWVGDPFEKRAVLRIDPHSDSAQRTARRLWMKGKRDDLLLDVLAYAKRVPGYGLTEYPDGNGYEFESQLHNEVMRHIDVYLNERGFKEKINEHPYIRRGLYWALRLVIAQRAPYRKLRYALEFGHPEFERMVGANRDEKCRYTFAELRTWSKMELERQLGPARRIIESAFDPPEFRERCDGELDLVEFYRRGGVHIVDAGGVAQEVMRPTCLHLITRAIQLAMKYRFPLLIDVDEADRGLINGFIVDACEQVRKSKVGVTLSSHSGRLADEFDMRLWQAVDRAEFFQCSPIMLADRLPAFWGVIDFHREHSREVSQRQRHAGFSEVARKRESKTKGRQSRGDGRDTKSESVTESWDTMVRPRYEDYEEERVRYFDSGDQLIEMARSISSQAPGERTVIQGGQVTQEYVTPLPEKVFPAFLEHHYEERFQRFLEEMRARPYFRTPRDDEDAQQFGAAWRLSKIQAEHNGSGNGYGGAHRP